MSDEKKESRFLQKWKLVRAAARDNKRLSTGDIAVLMALCDRYGSKYDADAPALAGHALLGAMSGLTRRATIDSTRRLIEAGYISVLELGAGTRGTRYGLNFARGEDATTTRSDNSSSEAEFTTVVNHGSPLDPLSGEAYFTESPPTESRLQAGLHVVGKKFEAAPVAPPTDALAGTVAGPASGGGDGFEEFWKVWPRKHGIKKAEAEWAKILYDVDIIIEVAAEWAAHYAKHDVDRKWIPEPANWLAGKRWLEDLPIVHGDSKGAAIAKAKANAKPKAAKELAAVNDNQPPEYVEEDDDGRYEPISDVGPFSPFGKWRGQVVDAEVYNDDEHTQRVVLTLQCENPGANYPVDFTHTFFFRHPDPKVEERGKGFIERFAAVLDLGEITDTDEILYKPMEIRVDRRLAISYARAA
ncbi:hypothetical protein IFT66_06885 [Rhizobium sp. CFBP 13726]|uniref:hypothetical protein n=1 Tax=Rhizobium sp. CFBP 13726 TaxID=2775296 RepID=UPI001780B8B7|nr:hypothetical protein [Rhizobium sp. CFBP 13726]MBD8650801.1 hypothetical protein [Rhizobium sp. CFBP 13726]